jgi:hypothetical protein
MLPAWARCLSPVSAGTPNRCTVDTEILCFAGGGVPRRGRLSLTPAHHLRGPWEGGLHLPLARHHPAPLPGAPAGPAPQERQCRHCARCALHAQLLFVAIRPPPSCSGGRLTSQGQRGDGPASPVRAPSAPVGAIPLVEGEDEPGLRPIRTSSMLSEDAGAPGVAAGAVGRACPALV